MDGWNNDDKMKAIEKMMKMGGKKMGKNKMTPF